MCCEIFGCVQEGTEEDMCRFQFYWVELRGDVWSEFVLEGFPPVAPLGAVGLESQTPFET